MADSARASDPPWFETGLSFRCTQCGQCCTGRPGYVWVTAAETDALATLRGLDRDTFGRRYLRRIGDRVSLIERPNGACIFLDEESGACQAYEARPRQCRTYPFWAGIVASEATWRGEAAKCPGIGEPTVVPAAEIARLVDTGSDPEPDA